MTPRLTVFVGLDHDLLHTSLVLTGMCALADRGDISLRYHRPTGDQQWLVADPMVLCFEVAGVDGRIAIDLRDGEGISQPLINRVRWYLKRAFYPQELLGLPSELSEKMQPFGLNYGCRSLASTVRLLAVVGGPLAARGRAGWSRLRQYLSTPGSATFEQSPDAPMFPRVAFQTRLWTSGEVPPDEVEPLNEGRVAVIRALRQAFGDRFVGGLVPTPLAIERYPGEVTPHSSNYRNYLAIKKRCLVGVYTRGVEHSLAFKLGETFAASQCLVSVPLRYQLPAPIEEGRHYLSFETPDECVAACSRLLDDAAHAREMRRANHDYYRREVEPAAHVLRVLDRTGVTGAGHGVSG